MAPGKPSVSRANKNSHANFVDRKCCFLSRGSPSPHLPPHCMPGGILSSGAREKWQPFLILRFAVLISQTASIALTSFLSERSHGQNYQCTELQLVRKLNSASSFSMASKKSVIFILLNFPSLQNRAVSTTVKCFQENHKDSIS